MTGVCFSVLTPTANAWVSAITGRAANRAEPHEWGTAAGQRRLPSAPISSAPAMTCQ
jgi:hypothetical protein